MRKYDIQKLLLSGENQSVEFKEAKNSFPKDGMKTICSFANTNDGLLILGISENTQNKEFYISGVNNPDKILDDLYSLVNNPKKTLLKLLLTIDFTRFLYNINTIITINIIIARTIPSSELMNSF